jgi:hypothetical protein
LAKGEFGRLTTWMEEMLVTARTVWAATAVKSGPVVATTGAAGLAV